MPRDQLIAEYKNLLSERGLSLCNTDEDRWVEILSCTEEVKHAKATDVPAHDENWLRAAARELVRYGGIWNFRIQNLVPGVILATERCLAELNIEEKMNLRVPSADDLFVGEFPTDHFNAVAKRATSDPGYLILINSGLCELLAVICQMISIAQPPGNPDCLQPACVTAGARSIIGLARKYQTRSSFVAVPGGWTSSKMRPFDHVISDWMHISMLAFVISHELSHIILRHGDPSAQPVPWGGPAILSLPSKKWREELSADALAILILQFWCAHSFEIGRVPSLPQNILVTYLLFAPVFFFDCENLLKSALGCSQETRSTSEHPTATMRQRFLLDQLRCFTPEHRIFVQAARSYRLFFRRIRTTINQMWKDGSISQVETRCGDVDDAKIYMSKLLSEYPT